MAPSSKHMLIAVLVTFAGLQPSAATSRKVAEPRVQPQFFFPMLPCIPGFPRLFPCYEPEPPAPDDESGNCWSPMMKLVSPCGEYLTNASVSVPPSTCCDKYNELVNDQAICLCHIANGDIAKLLPAPLNFTQLFAIPDACDAFFHLKDFAHCNMSEVPSMMPPASPWTPTEKASPPSA